MCGCTIKCVISLSSFKGVAKLHRAGITSPTYFRNDCELTNTVLKSSIGYTCSFYTCTTFKIINDNIFYSGA